MRTGRETAGAGANDAQILSPAIRQVFDVMPEPGRTVLLAVRGLIFITAKDVEGLGSVTESLKWGQPSYVPARPRTGSPVRLGLSEGGRPTLFCHCQTSLIADFQARYRNTFKYVGTRALILPVGPFPQKPLKHCIAMALTYHQR